MRLNLTKEAYIAKTENQITRREELVKFYKEVYLPTLKKFDGKVYNKRFITALRNEATELMYIREKENDSIVVELRSSKYAYNDYESLYCMIKLNDEGRIDYEASVNDVIGRKWIVNHEDYTEELRNSILHYDEYIEICDKLRAAIDNYKNVPHNLRETIHFCSKHYVQ